MFLNLFNSISSKIVLLIGLVLAVTAASIMYSTQRDVGKTMFDEQQKSARNVLELVRLNIRGGYNRLIADKIDILNRMKMDLRNVGQISLSVFNEFENLENQAGAENFSAKQRALSWLSSVNYEQISVFVFDSDGEIIGFSDDDNQFENFKSVYDIKSRRLVKVMNNKTLAKEGELAVFHWQSEGQPAVKKLAFFTPLPEWGWTIGVAIDFDNIEAESERVLSNIVKLLEKTFSKIKIASTGYAFLFDGNGEILIAPPNLEPAEFSGVVNSKTGNLLTEDLKRAFSDEIDSIRYLDPTNNKGELLEAHVSYFKAFNWYFAVVVPVAEIEAPGKAVLRRQMLVIGTIFLLSTVFTFIFVSRISRPLKVLSDYAKQLPKVDFTKETSASDQIAKLPLRYSDEVGRLANSFVFMEKELKKNITAAIESTAAKERLEREAAVEASRAKGEFLANMSHEIRTPINGMLGMMELLTHTHLDNRQKDFVMTLRDSGKSLLSIINNILDFSKIEASKMELEATRFSLGEVLESTSSMFAEMAQNKGIELVCSPDLELFQNSYIGDPSRIQQVVTNLGGNAIKFTEKGYIEISAQITEQLSDRVTVRVAITDTGVGLEDDVQSEIFNSFSQADTSTTRRYGGTGLGLSICKHLVELMGGEIGVDSSQGKGSTFWFTVSLKITKDHFSTRDEASHKSDQQPQNILLVTQSKILGNSFNRRVMAEQEMPLTVISVDDVPSYIERDKGADQLFDIILFDVESSQSVSIYRRIIGDLKQACGSDSTRCGLLVLLKQKFEKGISDLAGIDFAMAKPVPRLAIQRMLSADPQFWLDQNETRGDQKNSAMIKIGAKVLVAEDNAVNQKLITEMLRIFDCEMTLVENGRDAVLINQQDQFDMILMDCQMPEMDGYQATAKIRSQEQESGLESGVVIVALTANAREEDRERCLACGMNDYLSKPFKMAQLRDVIMKWHQAGEGYDITATNLSESPKDDTQDFSDEEHIDLLDLKTLAGIKALEGPQSSNILEQLFEIYRSTAPVLIEKLYSSIRREDSVAVRESAHSLKSSSGNMGARKLFLLSAKLEELGRDQQLEGALEVLEEIERLFPTVCRLLQREIQRPAA